MTARPPRRLQTERLELEATTSAHADGLYVAATASLPELGPWLAWISSHSPAQTRSFAENAARCWDRHEAWAFTILLADEVVGLVDLHAYRPVIESAEIGYWLRSDLAGRGLMTEAAGALCDFAFDRIPLHRVELQAGVGNEASIRVAEKLGFRHEGIARDASRGTDGYYDCHVFGLLRTDPRPWRER